jgi:predicted O-methyltransferase YrrM
MKPCTVAAACGASKTPFWSLLLFKLVRNLQPTIAVELGTCLGVSAAYQAAAQQLNGRGRIITLEGSAARAALSRKHLASLGLENATVIAGIFDDTLQKTLTANSPVDFAFIDGHHDEHATLRYYQQFLPHLIEETVVVFDDIAWSPGMRRAWKALQNDANVAVSIDMLAVGICVVRKAASSTSRHVKIRMPT